MEALSNGGMLFFLFTACNPKKTKAFLQLFSEHSIC
jgi:hypothetical protein